MQHKIKYFLRLSWLFLLGSVAFNSFANGYKVVLIHGLQTSQITSGYPIDVTGDGESYWSEFWGQHADVRIDWPALERIEGKIASDYVWPKLKQMSQQGTCQPGCILVTHSTGDLVARYLLDNQANWLENAGLAPLNIVATFDIAGAGGGSELADLAVSIAQGTSGLNPLLEAAIRAWLGGSVEGRLGVLNDLKVNNARQIAALPEARTPRLRFVADGTLFLGVTKLFLKGTDDSVVATHSACGASRADDFGSCSASVATSGKLASQSDAVSGFMPYHYPMLMSDNYDHFSVINDRAEGKVTAAQASRQLADGRTINFNTYEEETGAWFWKSTYRYVENSGNNSLSRLMLNAMQ
ncbi:hypothetical protein [Pseudoalteromonas rubra]|uniref:hypothetical protein n=1 Tax=Pseudoalteromonas rubra TaxID=43658 RepID=UPI000F786D7A|nr:hypothetical protein [Pseudoalteromonas rubra]